MTEITQAKIAILASNGFEQSELQETKKKLEDAGAEVVVMSPEEDQIRGWKDGDWGDSISVDIVLEDTEESDFDALVLPGGCLNSDMLRTNQNVVDYVRDFFGTGKTIAAICHAPWVLVEADVIDGRRITSYKSIKTDLINAGGRWENSGVVVDEALITAQKPEDIEEFCQKIIEEIQEGRHSRYSA